MRFLYAVIIATLLASVINAAPVASPLPARARPGVTSLALPKPKVVAPKPVKAKPVAPKPVKAKPVKTPVKKIKTKVKAAPAKTKAVPAKVKTPAKAKSVTPAKAKAPVKVKATAKAKSVTPAKAKAPAKVKATAKAKSVTPAKSKTPAKVKSVTPVAKSKAAAKAKSVTPAKTNTTTPAKTTPAKAKAPSCPVRGKGAAKGKAKVREIAVRSLVNAYHTLFRRAPEFVGYHGTNDKTAKLWTEAGKIVKPISDSGAPEGTSGADAELGPGLYIADTLTTAIAFANGNASKNKLKAKVCAIFASDSATWRQRADFPKFFFQDDRGKSSDGFEFFGNKKNAEVARQSLIDCEGGTRNSIRMGPFRPPGGFQMVIPESLNSKFFAQCFDVAADQENLVIPPGQTQPADIQYPQLLATWQATSRFDPDVVKAVKAAVTGKAPK